MDSEDVLPAIESNPANSHIFVKSTACRYYKEWKPLKSSSISPSWIRLEKRNSHCSSSNVFIWSKNDIFRYLFICACEECLLKHLKFIFIQWFFLSFFLPFFLSFFLPFFLSFPIRVTLFFPVFLCFYSVFFHLLTFWNNFLYINTWKYNSFKTIFLLISQYDIGHGLLRSICMCVSFRSFMKMRIWEFCFFFFFFSI